MRIRDWRLSFHAAQRMVEMGLTASDVELVLVDWDNRYEQSKYGPGRVMYQRGGVAVATAEVEGEDKVIVSVLWNKKEQWER